MNDTIEEPVAVPEQAEEPKKDEAFKVPEGGEGMNWVKVVPACQYDTNTGDPMEKPFVQAFDEADFALLKENHKALGYRIEVLHEAK